MTLAIIILSIIAYLAVGALLARVLFRPVWERSFHAYYDRETAAATGLMWPFIMVMMLAVAAFYLAGKFFGGDD